MRQHLKHRPTLMGAPKRKMRLGVLTGIAVVLLAVACLGQAPLAPPTYRGILVYLNPAQVASFNARHSTQARRLNPNRNLYLVTGNGSRSDDQLLQEIATDAATGNPALDGIVHIAGGSNSTSHLDGGSTASVLNGGSTASVLNGGSTASVLNGNVEYYGTRAPAKYVDQPMVGQIQAGDAAHAHATGEGVVIAEIDDGVDPFNPVLRRVLLSSRGYNFTDGTSNWSAYSDVCLDGGSTASVLNGGSTASVLNCLNGGSTGSLLNGNLLGSVLNGNLLGSVLNLTTSVLNGQTPLLYVLDGGSTASVLNGGSTASVLNGTVPCLAGGSTASVLNGGSTASVLNGGSTASVLNDESTAVYVLAGGSTASVLNGGSTASVLNGGSTASVLNGLAQLIACNPDFGHGTAVAGLLHLVAPEAKILPIKAFGANGEADAATIYEAITYAIDQHVNVINLSFSATETTDPIGDAIQEAVSKDIAVVAAGGNSSDSAAVFPASLSGVIGVGAVDGTAPNPTFPIASFSDFDPGPGQIVDVDVAAPGVKLFTTYPGFGLLWASSTGTSFSTPLVAGEAALLVQMGQTGGACHAAIDGSSNPSIAGDLNGQLGHGLINVLGAVSSFPPITTNFGYGGFWGFNFGFGGW